MKRLIKVLKLHDTFQPYTYYKSGIDLNKKVLERIIKSGEYIDENSKYTVFENYLFFRSDINLGTINVSVEASIGELPKEYNQNDINELIECVDLNCIDFYFEFN